MYTKSVNKKIFFALLLILLTAAGVSAEKAPLPVFIGLTPSVTVEPFYEEGELDINVVPIVFEMMLSKIVDVRLTSIVNLGFRNDGNMISHVGGQLAFPIYFLRKEKNRDNTSGIFAAPGCGVSRNFGEKHTNFGIWA